VNLRQSAENYYILGLVCARAGDKRAALAAIQEAMKRAPDPKTSGIYRKTYDQIRSRP
jgi:hypothetical protein